MEYFPVKLEYMLKGKKILLRQQFTSLGLYEIYYPLPQQSVLHRSGNLLMQITGDNVGAVQRINKEMLPLCQFTLVITDPTRPYHTDGGANASRQLRHQAS